MNEDDSINKPPLVSFTNKLPLIEIEPVNLEPICVVNEPDSSIEDVNGLVTLNPKSGLTDAVTEPDLISDDTNASSVNAALGISLK